jgi:hypothetical protein
MMKYAVILGLLMVASYAYAQSTAEPIQLGFLSTTGCNSGQTVCWLPYSASNPLYVTSN